MKLVKDTAAAAEAEAEAEAKAKAEAEAKAKAKAGDEAFRTTMARLWHHHHGDDGASLPCLFTSLFTVHCSQRQILQIPRTAADSEKK